MMKIPAISLVVLALASMGLSGCANPNKKETMVQSPDTTNKRVHTQEELQKTGQSETGPALEKVDPAVQVTGPH
jgi:outer membrane biogenesis lipoprotein LolB